MTCGAPTTALRRSSRLQGKGPFNYGFKPSFLKEQVTSTYLTCSSLPLAPILKKMLQLQQDKQGHSRLVTDFKKDLCINFLKAVLLSILLNVWNLYRIDLSDK